MDKATNAGMPCKFEQSQRPGRIDLVVFQRRMDGMTHAKAGEMQHQVSLRDKRTHPLGVAYVHRFQAEGGPAAASARFSRLPLTKLSTTVTTPPCSISCRTTSEPMKPAPPVTRTVRLRISLAVSSRTRPRRCQCQHPADLLDHGPRHFRIERQREFAIGLPLGNREVAAAVAELREARLQMHRRRIMQPEANAVLFQRLEDRARDVPPARAAHRHATRGGVPTVRAAARYPQSRRAPRHTSGQFAVALRSSPLHDASSRRGSHPGCRPSGS